MKTHIVTINFPVIYLVIFMIPFVFFIFLMPYGAAYYKKAGRQELEKALGITDEPIETRYSLKL